MKYTSLPMISKKVQHSVVAVWFSAVCFILLAPLHAQVAAQTVNIVDEGVPLQATAAGDGQTDASPTVASLPSPSPESTELANLRAKYRTELSIYRTDEREFSIAKEQYLKLQTLAALESSVQATRKVMLSRTAVLQTYLEILRLMVSNTSGIDVDEKAALIQQLGNGIDRLKTHQQRVEQAVDRNLILASVQDFNTFNTAVVDISYKSLSYIAYGRLQTVYDKTVSVKAEVLANVEKEEQNGLRLGEKRRALEEIDRSLASTKQNLDAVRSTFQPTQAGRVQTFDASSYGNTIEKLSTVYAELYRNLSFLREVVSK